MLTLCLAYLLMFDIIALLVVTAPEGWEDERSGFHFGKMPEGGV